MAQPTIIPSEGVQPYKFSSVNVGTGVGKLIKKGATTALQMRNIKAQHNVDMLETATKGADGKIVKTGAIPEMEATKAGVDAEIKRQGKKTRAAGVVPARTKAKVGKSLRRSSGALSKVQAQTFEPPFAEKNATGKAAKKVASAAERVAPSAVQNVTAARKKAKQVRPKKETSLSVKSL